MSQTVKHTPGPWALHPAEARVDAFADGRAAPVCALLWPTELRSEDETKANAHLIAAAPDMLAALRAICEPITVAAPPDAVAACQDLHELICEIAREAIARAEGR